ncbi:MAG TPA: S8 family serine peptidase, partial [Kofleriaceae bacterium]|nr:S8 family serine peptidase [Kofleriaceae bacterium]
TSFPRLDVGWAQETALDLDMASAICPACKILLVEGDTNSFANLAAAVNTAASLGAHVISNSYGGGESGSTAVEAAYNHAGVAITASSGDAGFGVEFPASSPHVVAVGGTSLRTAGTARGWTETAWINSVSGCAQLSTKPAWQHDTGCANRMVADVSAVADPATGVAVYGPTVDTSGVVGPPAWMVFGGTSAAAPIISGVYGVNGGTVHGGADPYSHLSGLFDIKSGITGFCDPTYFCNSATGYDGPTGLGTPNGSSAF